jgi:hypothetical protein
MLNAATATQKPDYTATDWGFLVVLTLVGVGVGLEGISHYGYVGQDFTSHRALILSYPSSFNYSLTNPPGLYWFGSWVRDKVSEDHYLGFMALSFLAINTAALWIVYGFIWGSIARWELRYAAAAFVTLVPFRVIHSVVIAADAFTLPIFALVAFFTFRLFEDPRRAGSWAGVSLSLLAGALCKYTFVGLLPPVALLLSVAIARRLEAATRLRWAAVAALALAVPTAEFLYEAHESFAVGGEVTNRQWLPKGAAPVMRWRDILLLQASDVGVLQAPGYFRDALYSRRKFSYPALLHLSAVTDVSDLFEAPPEEIAAAPNAGNLGDFRRERSPRSQALQVRAVRLCIVFSALAVAGTLVCGVLGISSLVLWKPRLPEPATVITALAAGFYSTVFLSLHRLGDPYTPGFWLPRLVLPAVVVFYLLGFVLLDVAFRNVGFLQRASRALLPMFGLYTLVACALFADFLA